MKKTNNKFRNNSGNNNNIYSLNYKFDSVCMAGKFNGTALDLIKRYNELAKEAQSRGDYVDMEVFRQYAEHYRKIVTEINARKNQVYENNTQSQEEQQAEQSSQAEAQEDVQPVNNGLVETEAAPREEVVQAKTESVKKHATKRAFTVVEVKEETTDSANENNKEKIIADASEISEKPRRKYAPRKKSVNTDAN